MLAAERPSGRAAERPSGPDVPLPDGLAGFGHADITGPIGWKYAAVLIE